MKNSIKKIVSGGQTGVDRAALDVAIKLNIPHGGWCPKGRIALDGPIAKSYELKETPSSNYSERTTWNVRDSDGTLIIVKGKPTRGTLLTIIMAKKLKKPCFIYDLAKTQSLDLVHDWIKENNISILNVAGPRASEEGNIYETAAEVMRQLLESQDV